MRVLLFILPIGLAYFVGSVPTGYLVGRFYGIDIRKQGSGNMGATNVYRVIGKIPGSVTFLIDFGKGVLPVYLSSKFIPDLDFVSPVVLSLLVGLSTIFGNIFNPFFKFKGGKGVATGAGVLAALLPREMLVSVAVFAITFSISRIVSLSSLLSVYSLIPSTWVLESFWGLRGLVILLALLITFTHRSNISRLITGTEKRFR